MKKGGHMPSIYTSQICKLEELNHLFIELTEKNCNQRCKECYIKFPMTKKVKDFIPIEKIRDALIDTKKENLECIYLTGAEPMTHPDFNAILRLCLKRADVCICTNGSFINEKKARFLKRVEDESDKEIYIKLPLVHYNEIKNDSVRSRGSYRQVMQAIKSMQRYQFSVIASICNFYNEPEEILIEGFNKAFEERGIEELNYQITEFHKDDNVQSTIENFMELDCKTGRILTKKGVFTCPFLANDYRGRCGGSFKDYTRQTFLESEFCSTCARTKGKMFSLN